MLGRNLRFAVISLALVLTLTALFAPFFGEKNLAVGALGIICHQKPERSLWVGAYPMALCARCSAVYFGVAISLFAFHFFWKNPRTETYIFAGAGFAPVAIDALFQGAGLYDIIALRLITGSLAGCAVAVVFHILLTEPKERK